MHITNWAAPAEKNSIDLVDEIQMNQEKVVFLFIKIIYLKNTFNHV